MTCKGCAAIGLLACVVTVLGCSGSVVGADPPAQDAGAETGHDAPVDAPTDTKKPDADSASIDAFEEYVDPGCPDAPAPVFDYTCDPLDPTAQDCPEGEACYPYVDYPSDPCEAEVYGSYCLTSGTGAQGEYCWSAFDCAPGFVCVVSGAGDQCVRICSLTDPSTCPDGQICEPLDVAGFGGCL